MRTTIRSHPAKPIKRWLAPAIAEFNALLDPIH